MPNGTRVRRRRRVRSRNRTNSSAINPSPSTAVYRGPYRLPLSSQQTRCVTMQFTIVTAVQTNGSGLAATVVPNSPTPATDWTSAGSLYDEFRILSATFEYVPYANMTYSSTYLPVPMVACIDRDSSGSLSSYNAAYNFESAIATNSNVRHKLRTRMSGIEDSGFQNIATAAPTWWYKLYMQNGTVTTIYGQVFTLLLVQLRGRL